MKTSKTAKQLLDQYNALPLDERAAFFSRPGVSALIGPILTTAAPDLSSAHMTRGEFDNLTPHAQSAFCLKGGRLTDDQAKATMTAESAGPLKMNRAAFAGLTPAEQSKYCRDGGKITD